MAIGRWQSLRFPKFHDQSQASGRHARQPDDPQAAHFQKAGERRRRAPDPVRDLDLVVGHQIEAPSEEAKGEIRLS